MKKIVCLLAAMLLLTLSFQSKAQHSSHHHEKAHLEKQLELAMDTAAKYMISFILTRIESNYHHSLKCVNEADSLNFLLLTKFSNHDDSTARVNVMFAQERKEEFDSCRNSWLKQEIEGEPKDCRKNKVKFRGKDYAICDKAFARFNEFIQYLPAN